MKVILATGAPDSSYADIFANLTAAGLAAAAPCRHAALSPQALQTQLLSSQDVAFTSSPVPDLAQLHPGKFWSQLASDLFVSNLQHPAWGWADPQCLLLLDFWQDFDPQVYALLVYDQPQAYLAKMLAHGTEPTAQSVSTALDTWLHWNTALLRYAHRHPQRCLLINAQQALTNSAPLLGELSTAWQTPGLDANKLPPSAMHALTPLQQHLIDALISADHPALALYQELEATARFPGADHAAVPLLSSCWAEWAALQTQRDTEAKAKAAAINQRDAEAKAKNTALAQCQAIAADLTTVTNTYDTLRKEHAALQAGNDRFKQELNQQAAQLAQAQELANSVPDLRQENELLLLQLRQVQDELESHFLKNQTLAPQAELAKQLQQKLTDLQTKQNQLAKANEEAVAQRNSETKAKNAALAQYQAIAAELASAKKSHDTLRKEHATLGKQVVELSAKLKQAPQSDPKLSAQLAELTQENELLLLQLHQVQEELEHYFLRNQELEKTPVSKASSFTAEFWRTHQPQTIVVDMRQDIAGSNWYDAESDGRWAGPTNNSTLQMPPLQTGSYVLELDIVDAMHLDIVNTLQIEALGKTRPVEVSYPLYQGEFPLICSVNLSLDTNENMQPWTLGLRFNQLISPADTGASDDHRLLALRLRTLRLIKQL